MKVDLIIYILHEQNVILLEHEYYTIVLKKKKSELTGGVAQTFSTTLVVR